MAGPTRPGRRGAGRRGRARRWRRRCRRRPCVRPWRVRTIVVGPRRATTRTVSSASASSRVPGRTRPSALLTTLLVTTTMSPSSSVDAREQERRQVVARAHLGRRRRARALDGDRGHATSSMAAAAMAAVRRGRSSSGVRRGRRSRRLDRGDGGVDLVDQPAVEHPAGRAGAVVQADPGGGDLDADRGEQLLGHPADVGAADDGGEADDRAAVAASASRTPGTPRMVPTETTGLDGGSTTRSASAMASRTPGAGVDVSSPTKSTASAGHLGAQPDPVLLEVHDPAAARARRGRRWRRGSRPGRRSSAAAGRAGLPAPAQRLGHLARAGSRRRASGCGRGGSRGRGRRGRTRSAPRRTPRARP